MREGPTARRVGLAARRQDPTKRLSDVLQIFTGLETDRASRRDAHFLAGAGIAADAALARFHLEDPESAKLDSLATLHGDPHRVEHRVDSHLGFDLGDVGG